MLSLLGYSGRHHNISHFILSQKLDSISMGIRDNVTRIIFCNTYNNRSLKILKDEFLGYLPDKKTQNKVLETLAMNNYLDINLNFKPPSYIIKK